MQQEALKQAYRYLETAQTELAQQAFEKILASEPRLAAAWSGLGLCFERQKQLPQAISVYHKAIDLEPLDPEFLNNLGICLFANQQMDEALSVFKRLLALSSDPEVAYNYAIMLIQSQKYAQALEILEPLIADHPFWEPPQIQLFVLMRSFTYEPDALSFLEGQRQKDAENAFAYLCLSIYYSERREVELAVRYCRIALRLNRNLFEAYRNLISLFHTKGSYTYAIELALRLHEIENSPQSALEVLISTQKPVVESMTEIHDLLQQIDGILDYFLAHPEEMQFLKLRSSRPYTINFYHMYYRGEDRLLQEKLAAFHSFRLFETQFEKTEHKKPRLGFVSLRFYDHSVMHLLQRAVETILASGKFETYVYFIYYPPTSKYDALTQQMESLSDHFSQLSLDYLDAMKQIRNDELDVLIYLDIGMDSLSYTLALAKLANYQLVLPGHPVTTGMKTIDYFISSQLLEPPGTERFYTEKLVRLPGLPDYQLFPEPAPACRQDLGLPPGNLYFCPMTIFKVHPEFDQLVIGILEKDPDAEIVFLQFKNNLHILLMQRFAKSMSAALYERIHFISWSTREIFFQRLMAVDVIMDTFYFGGGNTAYQAFGLACPVVCLDLPWSKSRWTQAMYLLMGIDDLIAKDRQDYIDISVRLAQDKVWQRQKRQQIRAKSAVLFDNPTWSEALLDFCFQLVQAKTSVHK